MIVFNHVSLDGYFTDAQGDMSFARNETPDTEWDAFVAGNASGGGMLVFGRITYSAHGQLLAHPVCGREYAGCRPADECSSEDRVFENTGQSVVEQHAVGKGDPADEIRRLKQEPGADMVIFGSGSIVSQLAQAGLIDEYQIVVDPVALGGGRTMFEGIKES